MSIVNEEIVSRNNELIRNFRKQFQQTGEAIEVKFRDLIPELKSGDRYTHLIHSYPAKLLVHIPYFFLNNTELSNEGDDVLDPFNGSGTVYLEGLLSGRNVFGADSNPLAKLIAKVKSTKYKTDKLESALLKIVNDLVTSEEKVLAEVINCDLWFSCTSSN